MKVKTLFSPINFSKICFKVVDLEDKEHDVKGWNYIILNDVIVEKTPLVDYTQYIFNVYYEATDRIAIKALRLYYDDKLIGEKEHHIVDIGVGGSLTYEYKTFVGYLEKERKRIKIFGEKELKENV